ncbi:MAG: alpha/beta fold hydrolase [SAR324 cluster bacterium]|nr:alpha/beta fold hydrolase [SAR324 cluster bacterium]
MNERLDPEEVQAIMGRVKEAAVRIVETHGGIVNQFVGDEVVALFGIPTAQEDDPRRAVAAALELHQMVARIGVEMEDRLGQGLSLHTGINTGLVVTQLRDDRDGRYGLTGDSVNTCARLAAQAQPGQILIGKDTQRLVAPYFELETLPPVTVKGKAEAITPFRVLRKTAIQSRLEASAQRGFTHFIGREMELSTLRKCMEQAAGGGGRFVSLVGDAGVGKSRLMHELREGVADGEVTVLTGRCNPLSSGTPFFPLLEPMRGLLNLTSETPDAEAVSSSLIGLDQALEPYIPHVLHLLSIPGAGRALPRNLDGEELQRGLRLALAALFTLAAQRKTILLLLEDWHWSDEASDAALKYLVGLIGETPIMIVVNYRPDYQPHWGNLDYLIQLSLTAFGTAESLRIVQQTLGVDRLPEQLPAIIQARTGGNPFFIEELCRSLLERGDIEIREMREAVLTGDLEHLALPETVQAVIRSRLDRLDDPTREVVLHASVIGREFSGRLLESLMPAEKGVPAALERLKALEILRQVRVVPEPVFRFKHVVTQEVAYETLLLKRRKQLHRKVAELLEAQHPERLAEIQEALAAHFFKGEVWPKAAAYSLAAAEQAKSHYSYRAAQQLGWQTLTAVKKVEKLEGEQIRALVLLGDLDSLLGELEPANSHYEQAMALSRDAAESVGIANRIHHPRFVVRDGGKIVYYEHGSGPITLIFVNPALYGIAMFQPLVERLCQDYRIITIDGRGSGNSDPIPDDYSMRDHMEDVRAVIDDAGATTVVGVGISRGGNQIIKLAIAYPGKLEKIVTIGMPVDDRKPGSLFPQTPDPRMIKALQEKDYEIFFQIFVRKFNPEPGLELYNVEIVKKYVQLPEKTILKFVAPDPEMNMVPLFQKIMIPILLIHGLIDGNVDPIHTRYAAEQIKHALVYEFPSAGHNPWISAPGEFCDVLRQFVETGEVAGAQMGDEYPPG